MASITATDARNEFFDLIKSAVEKHKIHKIHHRKGDVVLLSENEYESLLETLELLSIPGFRNSIKRSLEQIEKGETFSIQQIFGDKV